MIINYAFLLEFSIDVFYYRQCPGHHLIQTFAPSSLVVMLSWFSFWLGLDAIPGRVTLLVTCMLTLVTMFTGADIPPVAYVKALDLWMAGCMVFVFAALAEFVVVKVLDVQYQTQLKQTSKTIIPLRLTNIEKGQCQTVAMFDGTNVRSRKANAQNTPTPVSQVNELKCLSHFFIIHICACTILILMYIVDEFTRQRKAH